MRVDGQIESELNSLFGSTSVGKMNAAAEPEPAPAQEPQRQSQALCLTVALHLPQPEVIPHHIRNVNARHPRRAATRPDCLGPAAGHGLDHRPPVPRPALLPDTNSLVRVRKADFGNGYFGRHEFSSATLFSPFPQATKRRVTGRVFPHGLPGGSPRGHQRHPPADVLVVTVEVPAAACFRLQLDLHPLHLRIRQHEISRLDK